MKLLNSKFGLFLLVWSMSVLSASAAVTWRIDINGVSNTVGATETGLDLTGWNIPSSGSVKSNTFFNIDGGPVTNSIYLVLSGNNGGGGGVTFAGYARTLSGDYYTNFFRDGVQLNATNFVGGAGMNVKIGNVASGTAYEISFWCYDYLFGNKATQSYYNVTDGGNTFVGTITNPPNSSVSGIPTDLTQYKLTFTATGGASGTIDIFIQSAQGQNQKINAMEIVLPDGAPEEQTYEEWIAFFPDLAGDDALPGADPDEDGVRNENERVAGTRPNDPDSVMSIESFQMGPSGVVLSWSSVTGRVYSLSSATNLWPSEWQLVTGADALTPVQNSYTSAPPTEASSGYYLIEVRREP